MDVHSERKNGILLTGKTGFWREQGDDSSDFGTGFGTALSGRDDGDASFSVLSGKENCFGTVMLRVQDVIV